MCLLIMIISSIVNRTIKCILKLLLKLIAIEKYIAQARKKRKDSMATTRSTSKRRAAAVDGDLDFGCQFMVGSVIIHLINHDYNKLLLIL